MSYKYKDEILEDIGPEPNANFDIESERYYQKLEELDEVYRKAEAFDRIVKNLEKYDEQGINSLNVNYHDFGGDTACAIDDFKEGLTNE